MSHAGTGASAGHRETTALRNFNPAFVHFGSGAEVAKSPLLKNSIHFAFTASISAFSANADAISPATKVITNAILRMTNGPRLDVNVCACPMFPHDRRNGAVTCAAIYGRYRNVDMRVLHISAPGTLHLAGVRRPIGKPQS